MSKGLKIFLSILALISISLSISILFGWSPFFLKEESQPAVIEEKPILTPNPIPTDRDWLPELREMEDKDKDALVLPVEEKYLETALESKDNAQVLSFYLDPEASIRAIFNGKITKVLEDQTNVLEEKPFNEIRLERNDGQFWASYLFLGEISVNEGDIIEQGQEIAKAKEGGISFRADSNLSIWLYDKDGEFVRITKDLFSK
jgi:hypothetical protein